MTQAEKLAIVHGYGGAYIGDVAINTRLGIPAINLEDGPQGVGDGMTLVTTWPASIAVAATWDVDMLNAWGAAMGLEQRGKGSNVMLGPDINLARVPMGGRIFEQYGEDPYLVSKLATASINGIQSQGVIATAKHFIDNDQEYLRNEISIVVDERTQWEIYYAPFIAAVEAGVGAIMCSYNRINNIYACENSQTLGDLKNKIGFQGWVMSDWSATHSTVASALAGLDMEMPYYQYFSPSLLNQSIAAGQVPQSRLDDMVTRILTSLYTAGIMNSTTPTGTPGASVHSDAHNELAYKLAASSLTLLKNDGILPLTAAGQVFAVIGDTPSPVGGGSGSVTTLYFVSPLTGVQSRVAGKGQVLYAATGANNTVQVAAQANVVIVCAAFLSQEGSDRSNLQLSPAMNALIPQLAAVNPNIVVVLYGPGPVLMPWANLTRAILFGYFAGQELGNALADVLFGMVNPSGKLPYTFPVNQNDWFSGSTSQYPGLGLTMTYTEKLLVGYRWYDHQNITPLFAFGHGLSYTSYSYSDLRISGNISSSLTVALFIQNSGSMNGSQVVQLYLIYPASAGEPPKVLRGFNKVTLAVGASTQVNFVLQLADVSIWNTTSHSFTPVSGRFGVLIGSSSREIHLTGSFVV